MVIRTITASIAVAFVLGSGMVQAADQGAYLGVGLGQTKVKDACEGFTTCDDTDTGVKLFGGYQFVPNAAVEIGYVDLGKAKLSLPGASVEFKAHGFDVDFVGTLPLNDQFAVLARVGMFFWKVDVSGTGLANSSSASGNDLTYGLGLAYDVSKKVSVRFEWQQFKDLGDSSLNLGPTKDTDLLYASMVFRIN
jgi:OOP family OmpA-OmpF porin